MALVERSPVASSALVAPMRSVPWVTFVPPLKVLLPERITVSKPCLVSEPAPLMTPFTSRMTPRVLLPNGFMPFGKRPESMPPALSVMF